METGQHGERTFRDQDLIVVSPGVPFDVPQLVQARERGIPVIGEVELAARFLKGNIVAITGSNGKTTTTTLAGDDHRRRRDARRWSAETSELRPSRFVDTRHRRHLGRAGDQQLSAGDIETFHPKIAVVLNVTPDHLDRHHTFENYAAAKARIFENQTADDFAVLNADNATCVAMAQERQGSACTGSAACAKLSAARSCAANEIVWRDGKRRARASCR